LFFFSIIELYFKNDRLIQIFLFLLNMLYAFIILFLCLLFYIIYRFRITFFLIITNLFNDLSFLII
jgi:hypothetical protein